jgi:hypothetical protein
VAVWDVDEVGLDWNRGRSYLRLRLRLHGRGAASRRSAGETLVEHRLNGRFLCVNMSWTYTIYHLYIFLQT